MKLSKISVTLCPVNSKSITKWAPWVLPGFSVVVCLESKLRNKPNEAMVGPINEQSQAIKLRNVFVDRKVPLEDGLPLSDTMDWSRW